MDNGAPDVPGRLLLLRKPNKHRNRRLRGHTSPAAMTGGHHHGLSRGGPFRQHPALAARGAVYIVSSNAIVSATQTTNVLNATYQGVSNPEMPIAVKADESVVRARAG